MSLLNIFLISLALAMDAMAVGAANGAHHHRMKFKVALRIAGFFGFFQFFMPLVGWLVGSGLKVYIIEFDHWVSFILLSVLGIKMILESLKNVKEKSIDIHNLKILFLLSIATSVDALVVGITFNFILINVWLAVIIIGLTTFVLSLISIYLGKKMGELWGKKAEFAGGLVLIGIGLKILLSHIL